MEPNRPIFETKEQLEKYSKLSYAIDHAFKKKDTGNKIKTVGAFVGSYLGIMGSAVGIAATGSAMAGSLAFVAAPVAVVAASTAILNHYQSKKAKLNEREFMEQKNAESAVKEGVPYNPLPVEKGLSIKKRMTQAFSELGHKIKTGYTDIFSESAIRVSEESALNAKKKQTMMERFSNMGRRIAKNSESVIAKLGGAIYNGIEFADKKLNHMGDRIANKLDKALNEDLADAIESVSQKANKINDKIYHGFEDSVEFVGGKVDDFAQAAGRVLKNTGTTIVKLDDKLNEGLYDAIQSVNRLANNMGETIVRTNDRINDRVYNGIQSVNHKVDRFAKAGGRLIERSGAAIIKLDDKMNEGLYNTIQSANPKLDRFAQFGRKIAKNYGEAVTSLDNKLHAGLYNIAESVDGKVGLAVAAFKQMKFKHPSSSMSAGRSSAEDAKNIEKMASAMADLRNAFGVVGESDNRLNAFGAKKLEASMDSSIKNVVVGLRNDGNHKAIFDELSNHLNAISGYGYNLSEKGGLSQAETAERVKTIIDCAETLGANPETMWHAYHQAENKVSESSLKQEEPASRMMM